MACAIDHAAKKATKSVSMDTSTPTYAHLVLLTHLSSVQNEGSAVLVVCHEAMLQNELLEPHAHKHARIHTYIHSPLSHLN